MYSSTISVSRARRRARFPSSTNWSRRSFTQAPRKAGRMSFSSFLLFVIGCSAFVSGSSDMLNSSITTYLYPGHETLNETRSARHLYGGAFSPIDSSWGITQILVFAVLFSTRGQGQIWLSSDVLFVPRPARDSRAAAVMVKSRNVEGSLYNIVQ